MSVDQKKKELSESRLRTAVRLTCLLLHCERTCQLGEMNLVVGNRSDVGKEAEGC